MFTHNWCTSEAPAARKLNIYDFINEVTTKLIVHSIIYTLSVF